MSVEQLAGDLIDAMVSEGVARMVVVYNLVEDEVVALEKRFFGSEPNSGGGTYYPKIEHESGALAHAASLLIAERHAGSVAAGGQLEVDAEYKNVRFEHAWEESAEHADPDTLTVTG